MESFNLSAQNNNRRFDMPLKLISYSTYLIKWWYSYESVQIQK